MPCTSTILLVLLVSLAGYFDLRYRRIPNWLIVSGLAFALTAGALQGWSGIRMALLGMLCAFAVYLPLYLLRGMGAGDVKLMAAVGALCGPHHWLYICLITALLGGLASLVLVLYRGAARQTAKNVTCILVELLHGRPPAKRSPELDIRNGQALRLPHGVVIAAGCVSYAFAARP